MVLLLQTEVTEKVEHENQMTALTENQLDMLVKMFPRHVLGEFTRQLPCKFEWQNEWACSEYGPDSLPLCESNQIHPFPRIHGQGQSSFSHRCPIVSRIPHNSWKPGQCQRGCHHHVHGVKLNMIDLEVMTRAAYTYCTCQCYHTLCSIPACCPPLNTRLLPSTPGHCRLHNDEQGGPAI